MLGGNVTYAATQWLVLVVIAKWLGSQAVGQFALGLAVASPIFAFAGFRLRAVQATDVNAEYSFSLYLGLRIAASAVSLLLIFMMTIFWWSDTTSAVVLWVSIAKAAESLGDIAQGFMQRREMYREISISQTIKGVTSVLFILIAAEYFSNIVLVSVAFALSRIVPVLGYDNIIVRQTHARPGGETESIAPNFAPDKMRRLMILAFPIGIVLALNTLQLSLPRFALDKYFDESMVGIYAGIAYVAMTGATVVNAMGQTALPRLAVYFREDIVAFKWLMVKLVVAALLLGVFGVLLAMGWGNTLLSLLYTSEYSGHEDVFIWVMLGGAATYVAAIIGVGVTASRSFVSQAIVSVPVTAAVGAGCYVLVPLYGMSGAAISVLLGAALKFTLQGIQIASVHP